ncbi:MAG TPA: PAS domain S-box protein [Methylomirabilota bacterium]|nr:PAS domain S-box protein [Methylomirabilota bacterium]
MSIDDDDATFRDFFEHAALGLHLVAADGTILHANQTELDLLGYRREEYIGRHIGDFHADADVIADILARLKRGETLHDYEARLRAKDGSLRHVLITSNVRRRPTGEFLHSRCFTRDITALKRADAERQATEARFELLARIAPVGLFRTDAAGDCVYVNPRWCEITGLPAEDARGSGWAATLHPDDRQRVFDAWYRAARTSAEFESEYRFVRPDGAVRWVVGRAMPEWSAGAVIGYIGMLADVTDRKEGEIERERLLEQERAARAEAERLNRAKDQFLEQQSRLAAIVDNSDDAIVSKTLTGVIRSWNRGAERMFGWSAEEAVGRHITLIIPEDRRFEEDEVLARIRRGDMVDHFETVRVAKDGRRLHISLTVSPVKDGEGRIVGASKIARDVTERRRLEEERERLLLRERQAREEAEASNRTKEQLLAIVSHELRTPLNSILGYARMLQSGSLDETTRPHAVDVIVRSAAAQARLVEDLLDLSRIVSGRLALSFEACEVAALIEGALDTVLPAADSKGVELIAELAPDLGQMTCDPDRIRQVIWNLVMNAIKFTSAGGRIDVTVSRTGGQLQIVVADTGVGISAEVLPHVFEPFRQEDSSTTRAQGGLGLGLALVKNIVELHGGRVFAESPGKGKGSTFTAFVPTAAPTVPQLDGLVLGSTASS